MKSPEPFGTTPFPVLTADVNTAFDVKFFASDLTSDDTASTPQQPQTQQIAVYEATPIEESIHGASVIAVNQHFICYAVKNGLIRVLNRHSTLRTLLRAHAGQNVTDIKVFQDGDVFATAGSGGKKEEQATKIDSKIVIWRIFERSPDIVSEKLLEIETDKFSISRVLWHPFNPNQFWMIHLDQSGVNVASLVETTRIATVNHPSDNHPLCRWEDPRFQTDFVLQVKTSSRSNLTDICWNNRDTRYVLSVHDSGHIVLWDISSHASSNRTQNQGSGEGILVPLVVGEIVDSSTGNLSRCLFLPHENSILFGDGPMPIARTTCFITAGENNSSFTLWSAWPGDDSLPSKIQRISIMGANKPVYQPPSSFLLDVCFGPAGNTNAPPCFIVCADREVGRLFVFHCRAVCLDVENVTSRKKAMLAGCDYVVPFITKFPTYSVSVVCVPTQDISEEELSEQGQIIFDMKLFSYQSSVVQCLTLTSYMCLPPSSTWTDRTACVIVERLHSHNIKQNGLRNSPTDEVVYDEDYDVEDDGVDINGFEVSPEASSLPLPDGLPTSNQSTNTFESDVKNQFSNWLGAIAASSDSLQTQTTNLGTNGLALSSLDPVSESNGNPQLLVSYSASNNILNNSAALSRTALLSSNSFFEKSKSGAEYSIASEEPEIPDENTVDSSYIEASYARWSDSLVELKEKKTSVLDAKIRAELDQTTSERTKVESQTQPQHQTLAQSQSEKVIQNMLSDDVMQLIVPIIHQAVSDGVQSFHQQHEAASQELLSKSVAQLQKSIDTLSNQRSHTAQSDGLIAEYLLEPVNMAFSDSLKSVIIPFLESITGQILKKVSDYLEKLQHWHEDKEKCRTVEIESMSKQLSTMTQLVAKLTDEVQALRSDLGARCVPETVGKSASTAMSQAPRHHVDSVQSRRNEILLLLREQQFELAFTKAVSASAVDLVVLCCRHTDLSLVLGGDTPALSQPILLCTMQQLGTLIPSSSDSDLQLEMEWLQEITMSLDPVDVNIQRHGPSVFQQVVNNINQKLKLIHGTDQNQLRRQLQRMLQLIRGISIEDVAG